VWAAFFCLSLLSFLSVISFVIPWCALSFLGQAFAEGKGELATSRLRADSGREPVKMYAAIVYIG
jgi:hypothetical protein